MKQFDYFQHYHRLTEVPLRVGRIIISQEQSVLPKEDREIPEVDVLIAVHNGSKYLREQLVSVAKQRGVKINLLVGFDGIDEASEVILSDLKSRFQSIKKYYFSEIGVDDNFSLLLRESRGIYIATCDQDDIWLEDHLEKSIQRMIPDYPSLIFSQLAEFNSKSGVVNIWPILKNNQIPTFSIFENVARGCTQVINSQARELILSVTRPYKIPRDWWFYAVVHHRDGVRFLPEVTVNYRLHESNLIGADRRIMRRFYRFYKYKLYRSFTLANELQSQLTTFPSTNSSKKLDTLMKGLNGGFVSRLRVIFFITEMFRSDILTDILLRAILLFSKRGESQK